MCKHVWNKLLFVKYIIFVRIYIINRILTWNLAYPNKKGVNKIKISILENNKRYIIK